MCADAAGVRKNVSISVRVVSALIRVIVYVL